MKNNYELFINDKWETASVDEEEYTIIQAATYGQITWDQNIELKNGKLVDVKKVKKVRKAKVTIWKIPVGSGMHRTVTVEAASANEALHIAEHNLGYQLFA